MTVSIENTGDDSYMTNVTFDYPSNLQLNSVKPANNPNVKCFERRIINSYNSTMNCNIQHPVFKATKETFYITWQLSEERFPEPEAIIYSNVSNLNGLSASLLQKTTLLVKHSISSALTVQPSTIYVKIPSVPASVEEVEYSFKVSGENPYGAELGLELQIPISVNNQKISDVILVQKTHCSHSIKECRNQNASSTHKQNLLQCLIFRCNILKQEDIRVTTKLFLQTLQKIVEDTQELNITGELLYDKEMYVNVKEKESQTQVSIIIFKEKELYILPVIIGGSVGGIVLLLIIVLILCKCGFFKRKYKQSEPKEK